MDDINRFLKDRSYHSSCPVCGSTVLNYKYTIDDFTIIQCGSCKVMFVKERLSQEELDYHYAKAVEGTEDDEDHVYLNQQNIENLNYYYKNLRTYILERVPKGKVLDIGCNAGYFLDVMEGFECYGIERSPSHGNIAKEKYGDNVFIGTFEEYEPPDFLFDCITLQDVLDHMVDPVETLKKCSSLLKPDGVLVVKVHDMDCLYAKLTGENFYAFVPPLHLFYFNRTSLPKALENASFKIVLSKHMGHLLLLNTIFYRLARGDHDSIFFKLHEFLKGTWLGDMKVRKNLRDIITVIAMKK